MKKKVLFFAVMIIAIASILVVTASAKMIVSDEYITDQGEFYAKEVNGSGYFAFDASYLSTDGTTKDATFYYKGSWYKNAYVLDGIYIPSDFDLTQVILTPDGYVEKSGTSGAIGYTMGGKAVPISTITSVTVGEGSLTLVGEQSVRMLFEAISFPRHLFCVSINGDFGGCDKLSTVTYNGREAIPKTAIFSSEITELNAFGGTGDHKTLTNIERLIFEPRTTTLSIGQYAFSRGILKEIVFGAGSYNLNKGGRDAISHQYNESGVGQLKSIVVEEGVTLNGFINWELKGNYDIVFIGDEAGYENSKSGFLNNLNANTGVVRYENNCYVYGHTFASKPIFSYANGYDASGVELYNCLKEDCSHTQKGEDLDPLFEAIGYSTRVDGSGGIMAGFKVNRTALIAYEENIGKELEIGLIIANADTINDTLLDENGALTAKGLQVEIEVSSFPIVNISIDGFDVSHAKTLNLVSALYVGDGNGYSFIQSDKKPEFYQTKTIGEGEDAVTIETITLYSVAKATDVNTLNLKGNELIVE